MRVNVNSWHYKLIDWLDFSHCRSLCAYFWQVVLTTFLVIVIFPICGFAGGAFITMPLWHTFSGDPNLTLAAGIIAAGEIVVLLLLLRAIVKDRHAEEMFAGKREASEPNLIYAWIKAKHDKVCPLIEFTKEGKSR